MARTGFSTSNYLHLTSAVLTGYPCTIAFWGYSASSGVFQTGVALSNSGSSSTVRNCIQVNWGTAPNVLQALAASSSNYHYAATAVAPPNNTWFHACGTFASSTSRAIYLDGGNKDTDTLSITPSGINRVGIGAFDGTSAMDPWGAAGAGRLAEVGIWNVALTDAEVLSLSLGIHPFLVRPSALVAYWPLLGRNSPENNLKSNTAAMTIVGSLSQVAHPRIFNYNAGVSRAALGTRLVVPTLFTESDTFYAPAAAAISPIVPNPFNETDVFYAETVLGIYALTDTARFNETDTFNAHILSADNLRPGLFTDTEVFYTPTVAGGAVALIAQRLTDSDVFYAPAILQVNPLVVSLLTDPDQFFDSTTFRVRSSSEWIATPSPDPIGWNIAHD